MTGSVDPGYLMFSISSSLPPLFELKYTNEFFSFSMLIWWHGIRYTAEANDTKPCWVCFCCTFVVQSRSFWFSLQIFTFYLYSDTKARHTHSHRMIAYNVTSKKKHSGYFNCVIEMHSPLYRYTLPNEWTKHAGMSCEVKRTIIYRAVHSVQFAILWDLSSFSLVYDAAIFDWFSQYFSLLGWCRWWEFN